VTATFKRAGFALSKWKPDSASPKPALIPVVRPLSSIGLVVPLIGLILAGCSSIGPGSVTRDRVDYANAVSDSWKDQMLTNIVRLRYADAPTFMDVSSVISAYTIGAQAQVGGAVNFGVPPDTTMLPSGAGTASIASAYADRPTISYTPLSGRKFAQSLLQPVPPAAIFSLIAAGYPVDLVIPVTVRALNGVYNRSVQSGHVRPSDPEFYPMLEAWKRIQQSRSFSVRVEKRGEEEVALAVFASRLESDVLRDIEFLKDTLKVQAENGQLKLVYGALPTSPDELAVLSRSMLEIMIDLSSDIEVPPEHVAAGRTYGTATLPVNASPHELPQIRIHSGAAPPKDAFTAVPYRDTWYWISDNDLLSKRTLTFLLLFFSLAETGVVPEAPVLTIPVQ
jgi:hypothetical protein